MCFVSSNGIVSIVQGTDEDSSCSLSKFYSVVDFYYTLKEVNGNMKNTLQLILLVKIKKISATNKIINCISIVIPVECPAIYYYQQHD